MVEQRTENPRVPSSILGLGTNFSPRKWLSGRASPCQGEGREFESHLPLQYISSRLGTALKRFFDNNSKNSYPNENWGRATLSS